MEQAIKRFTQDLLNNEREDQKLAGNKRTMPLPKIDLSSVQ